MQPSPSLKTVIDGLGDLLAREKASLLAGRYEALAVLSAEKERLAVALDAMLIDPAYAAQAPAFTKKLSAIIALASENETLIAAAKLGVVSAKARVRELINRQRTIGVYGSTGEKLVSSDACVSRRKLA